MTKSRVDELEEQVEDLEMELDAAKPAQDLPLGTYLGDGCYVAHDGYALVLATTDGVTVTNRVVLEPEVYSALTKYVEQLPPARRPR